MRHILFAVLILALGACGRGVDTRLERADALMEDHPDSALAIISAIDTAELRGDRNRAEYGLLLTQARHKCDYVDTDDSLISAAARYFDDHGPARCKMLARFYHGVLDYNAGRSVDAITNALDALSIAEAQNEIYWQARNLELIADIYFSCYNMVAASKNYGNAANLFKKDSKIDNAIYAKIYQCRAIQHGLDPNLAIAILDSIGTANVNSTQSGFIEDTYALSYTKLKRWRDALYHSLKAQEYWNDDDSVYIDWPTLVHVYLALNDIENAETALKKTNASQQKIVNKLYAEYLFNKSIGNNDAAFEILEHLNNLSDKNVSVALNKNVATVESDYYNSKVNLQRERTAKLKLYFILFGLFSLLISIAGIIIWRVQLARRNTAIEMSMLEIKIISEKLENANNEIMRAKDFAEGNISLARKLFKTQFKTLDTLSKEYYDKRDLECLRKTLYKDIEKEIHSLKTDEAKHELIKEVNDCLDNIITKYKNAFPKATIKEIYFIALLLAGFSPKTICLICDISISGYYARVHRIGKKIQSSDNPDKQLFEDIIR